MSIRFQADNDVKMIGYFRGHLAAGKSSSGLLIVAVEAVVYVWALFDRVELRDQADYLPSISRHFVTR